MLHTPLLSRTTRTYTRTEPRLASLMTGDCSSIVAAQVGARRRRPVAVGTSGRFPRGSPRSLRRRCASLCATSPRTFQSSFRLPRPRSWLARREKKTTRTTRIWGASRSYHPPTALRILAEGGRIPERPATPEETRVLKATLVLAEMKGIRGTPMTTQGIRIPVAKTRAPRRQTASLQALPHRVEAGAEEEVVEEAAEAAAEAAVVLLQVIAFPVPVATILPIRVITPDRSEI